jgi:hypothetical protein
VAVAVAEATITVVIVPVVGDAYGFPGGIVEGYRFEISKGMQVTIGGDGTPTGVEQDVLTDGGLGPGGEGGQEEGQNEDMCYRMFNKPFSL